jgi:hypothetical protein
MSGDWPDWKKPLRKAGLLDRVLPPTPEYPEEYTQLGILPMVASFVREAAEHVVFDAKITLRVIRQDHPRLNALLPGDVWEIR